MWFNDISFPILGCFRRGVAFELTPSVPSDTAQCPYHVDKSDPKMRYERACEYERVTLCAMDALGGANASASASARAGYVQCLDSAPLPLAYNATWPRACATQLGGAAAWQDTAACFSGARGDALMAGAQRATAQADSGIPSVQVNGTTVCGGNGVHCSFDAVAAHL